MPPPNPFRKYRVTFQVTTIACGVLLLALGKTDLKHWQYAFLTSTILIAVCAAAIILGIVYALKESAAEKRSSSSNGNV
jgi:phosphatidylglycerophosphate synthase